MNEPCKQPPSSGSESEADKEDDVKVCDICGDAGQEDLLAICSRCIDGAEHTYCMRTMLTKLPGSDWLCEGCKFNEELENQKFKSEMETMISVQACSNADSLDTRSSTQSKITSEKNGTVRNSEDNIDCTMIQSSQMSVTKQLGNVDPDMVSLLSSDDSIVNLDSAIRKLSSHPGGSYSILQGQKAQKSSGSLLRSTSFNRTDAKPKVKQILKLSHWLRMNGGARKPMLTSSSLISKYCNPDSLSRVKCISDADTWRYVDVELEKINKEDDVLSDKSSSFSPERETQRKRSYSTFKGSFSNVSLPLLRNSGRSSSFACVDGMMQKIAKHGQEDISFFGEENSGPPSVDGIRILYFPTLLNQSYVLKILNYYQVARKAHWKTPFFPASMVSYGKNDKIPEDGEELPASLSLSLGFQLWRKG
ncbi:hypothetical protein HPP92_028472, partial [Vanilla planifolia]